MDWHGWIWVRPTIEDNQCQIFWSGKWWSTNINWILSGYPIDTSSLFSDTLRLSCLLFVAKKNRQMAGHSLRIWSPKFFDGLSLGASGISSQDICSHTREYLYNAYVCMYVCMLYIYMYIHVTQLMVSTHSHHSPIVLPPQKLMSLPGRRFRNRPKPTDPMDQMDQIQARSVVYPTMTDMYHVYGHSHMLHLYIYIYYRDLYNKYNII